MLVNKLPRVVSRALVINIRARAQKEAHSEGMCVKVPKYWNINNIYRVHIWTQRFHILAETR